jgi:hypothetical protein
MKLEEDWDDCFDIKIGPFWNRCVLWSSTLSSPYIILLPSSTHCLE